MKKTFHDLYGTCKHYLSDGAGHYCGLIPMEHDEDYPHNYWRVFCLANPKHLACEKIKRNGKLNNEVK